MQPKLTVLTESDINQILSEAFRILSELGIEVRGKALRQRLLDHGLRELPDGRLSFDEQTVHWAIDQAPSRFTLYNRDGEQTAVLGDDNVHFVPASSGLKILDHRTGQTRLANTADFVEYVRLGNGLQNIPYLATAFSTNDDIEPQVSDAWRLYLCLTNSKKPIVSGAFTEHGVPRMAQMMQLFRQDKADLISRPMSIFTITATGNFRYGEDSCQNLLDCVEWGIPIEIVPVTLMGLIAPVTLFGATVFHTADVLAGITMAQIVRPGTPVLFGGAPAEFHMKEATSPMLGIEALHLDLAYAAVGNHLNLPTQAYMALSDAKFIDAQAGAETFGSAVLAALSGINSVSGPGMLDFVLLFSLPKLVLDDELCGQALRLLKPIAPQNDVPTIDLARELLVEQHLITAEHTLAHWPQSLYMPGPVYDRTNRETWNNSDKQDLVGRATRLVEEKLATYRQLATPPEIDEALRELILDGLKEQTVLPPVPKAIEKAMVAENGRRRRRRRRA